MQKLLWPTQHSSSSLAEHEQRGITCKPEYLEIPTDGTDVWEIDPQLLKSEHKVASGSYGDL